MPAIAAAVGAVDRWSEGSLLRAREAGAVAAVQPKSLPLTGVAGTRGALLFLSCWCWDLGLEISCCDCAVGVVGSEFQR